MTPTRSRRWSWTGRQWMMMRSQTRRARWSRRGSDSGRTRESVGPPRDRPRRTWRTPMRPSRVRALLADGGTAVNGWLTSDSSYLAEALSHAGFDAAITVDLQHGMFDLGTAVGLIQAISAGPAEPFARCSSHDPAMIGKLLDAGAYGLICPGIDTPTQAAALVEACRYPPRGRRSYGPTRAPLYGGSDYSEHADAVLMVWAMIES